MNRIVSPCCLILALLSLICGFALLAKGGPEMSTGLHQAIFEDNEGQRELLEAKLKRDRWVHYGMISGLFLFAVFFAVTGFLILTPAERQKRPQ